ncbi:MAG TPA: hypothetical protein V6D05_10975 [Stenomitos sp.]
MKNHLIRGLALATAGSLALALAGCPAPGTTPGQGTNSQPLPGSNVQNGIDLMKLTEKAHIAVGAGPHGLAFAGGYVVNDSPKAGTIAIIDPATEQVVQTLTPDSAPGVNAAVAPSYTKATHDGNFAVHLDGGAEGAAIKNTVMRVVNPATKAVVQTINLGKAPGSKFVWGDDHRAYVTAGADVADNIVLVDFGSDFTATPSTHSLSVDRTGATTFTAGFPAVKNNFLAVPNGPDNSVSFVALDPATGLASGSVTSLTYGNNPGPVDIATYGGKNFLIYGNKNSNTAVVYNLGSKSLVNILNVGSAPTDLALRSDGRYAYMTCKGSGEVAVIDVSSGALVSLLKVGRGLGDQTPNPVHIYAPPAASGANEQIWVGGDGDASVTVIDAVLNKVIAVVQVGVGHHKMAFTADGTKAFVSNITDNTVSVVDRTVIK